MTDAAATILLSFALLGAGVLFLFGVWLLAVGARWFAEAVRAAHTARAHAAQADEQTRTLALANDALEEAQRAPARAPYIPPSDGDLREAIIAARNGRANHEDEGDYTTEGNEGIPDQPPIMEGGFYRGQ